MIINGQQVTDQEYVSYNDRFPGGENFPYWEGWRRDDCRRCWTNGSVLIPDVAHVLGSGISRVDGVTYWNNTNPILGKVGTDA